MRQTAKFGLRTAAAIVALGVAFTPGVAAAQNDTSPQQNNAPVQNNNAPSQNTPSTQPSGTTNQNPGAQNQQATPDVTDTAVQAIMGTFTVKKIDKAKRTLTLADGQGHTQIVKAGPDVDINKLKTGQRLDVTYYEEAALAITKPGQPAPKISEGQLQRGGVTATQTTVTEKIIAVDSANHTVTLQGPQGNKHVVNVNDPSLQAQLGQLKSGDNVQLTYTQALAVSAEPSQQQPTQKQPMPQQQQQPKTQPQQ